MSFDNSLRSGRQLFRFAVDIGDRKRPEGNEIDSRDEFSKKRRGELPVPAKKKTQRAGHAQVEYVIRRRGGARDEQRKDCYLDNVCDDRQG